MGVHSTKLQCSITAADLFLLEHVPAAFGHDQRGLIDYQAQITNCLH